ncbi:MAG: protease HtpX [Dehalococcoidia bacterium SM23_28_2]|nr:MAG: protease HtpX [Dehalococcoidia bacterium SM23_28_2]
MNQAKTVLLLGVLSALFLGLGYLFGGVTGLIVAFGFSLLMNAWAYWFSDKLALRMAGAHQVAPEQEPHLHRMVEEVAGMAGLPKPKVYIVQNDAPNAFATGRNPKHSAVAVTTGIMRILNEDELKGVLAHELGHIKNRDILISAIVATIASAIMFIAFMARWSLFFGGFGRSRNQYANMIGLAAMIAIAILAPIGAMVIRAAISRQREYGADEAGARISGRPLALASALRKLQMSVQTRPMRVSESTAHMYTVSPLRSDFMGSLFSTHPPTDERIARLERMAERAGVWG